MNTTKRLNITVPEDVADILKGVKNKSAFIAEAVREYKKQKDKEKLIAELKEGYLPRQKRIWSYQKSGK